MRVFPLDQSVGALAITTGPDGALWFVERGLHQGIGRKEPRGAVKSHPLAGDSFPEGIAPGPDGNVWFTESGAIGRITTEGLVTEFPDPDRAAADIAAGADGNLWFTERATNHIGRITQLGVISYFAVPTPDSEPLGITTGPDGNVWFTEYFAGSIGRITPDGTITEFHIPTRDFAHPLDICAGPDGNLWFTENGRSRIGRITPDGDMAEFRIANDTEPLFITAGPDGNVWFTDQGGVFRGPAIGYVTPEGQIFEFATPLRVGILGPLATGPDGRLWFGGAIDALVAVGLP
jgi:virginiamycin B lyase